MTFLKREKDRYIVQLNGRTYDIYRDEEFPKRWFWHEVDAKLKAIGNEHKFYRLNGFTIEEQIEEEIKEII